MINVTRSNEKESVERLINRFNKRVQKSRMLPFLKENRYHKKDDTKRQVRKAAVMREYYRAERNRRKFY